MDNTGYVALSLAQAMRRELDVTSNNIANASTAGYKGEHIVFENYLHDDAGLNESEDVSFVLDTGSYLDARQGPVSETGNPLDVAILGQGWLSYQTPEGQTAYGRDGRFAVNAQGTLVTLSGAPVLDTGGGVINIPQDAGEVMISRDGTISTANNGPIGRLGLFALPDLQALDRIGAGMFVRAEGAPPAVALAATDSEIVQGSIEGSNVQPVVEMTRMIEIQRAYERAVNLMSSEDDLRRDTLRRLGQSA